MTSFNWNSIDESTFQGNLHKYTNAFKGYQNRYFVLDSQTKILLYFMPDEVRKKGPRGMIELTDCWVSPSNEDDVTFTVQTGTNELFKLRAIDAKERQKWIDKLRTCSGTNAATIFVSSLPVPKSQQTNALNENYTHSSNRRNTKLDHHQQTLAEIKEVIRCVALSQREFIETIDSIPDSSSSLRSMSTDMLILRSISQSCIISLQDSLTILTRRRTPETESLPLSSAISNKSLTPTNSYSSK